MARTEKVIIERTAVCDCEVFTITLSEIQPYGPMPHGLQLKVWRLVVSSDAPIDLDSHVQMWFHEFEPAMAVVENIYRHGDFDEDSAIYRALESAKTKEKGGLVRLCGTQDFGEGHESRVPKIKSRGS